MHLKKKQDQLISLRQSSTLHAAFSPLPNKNIEQKPTSTLTPIETLPNQQQPTLSPTTLASTITSRVNHEPTLSVTKTVSPAVREHKHITYVNDEDPFNVDDANPNPNPVPVKHDTARMSAGASIKRKPQSQIINDSDEIKAAKMEPKLKVVFKKPKLDHHNSSNNSHSGHLHHEHKVEETKKKD